MIFPFECPIIKPYFAEDNDQITEIKKSSIGFRQQRHVPELVSCTKFEPIPFSQLKFTPEEKEGGEYYAIPMDDFKFAIFKTAPELELKVQSAEILLALDADMTLTHASGEFLTLAKGESVFISAYVGQYKLSCKGRVARVFN